MIGGDGKPSHVFVPISESIYINGSYYVDSADITGGDILMTQTGETEIVSSKQALQGVYCVNEGYCEFRPIEIRYQNKEYSIVSDDTNGGLMAYDHIVVDPSNLDGDDFIE